MTETPQILLAHHLKMLMLPTFLREYDKVARQCAAEGADHPRYLMRLAEMDAVMREHGCDRDKAFDVNVAQRSRCTHVKAAARLCCGKCC